MDTKSLRSQQVCWAQKLFYYYFQIDYHQDKANKTADALFWYFLQSAEEEKTLWTKNVKILHCLKFLLTNIILSGLSTQAKLLLLYWVLIYST